MRRWHAEAHIGEGRQRHFASHHDGCLTSIRAGRATPGFRCNHLGSAGRWRKKRPCHNCENCFGGGPKAKPAKVRDRRLALAEIQTETLEWETRGQWEYRDSLCRCFECRGWHVRRGEG